MISVRSAFISFLQNLLLRLQESSTSELKSTPRITGLTESTIAEYTVPHCVTCGLGGEEKIWTQRRDSLTSPMRVVVYCSFCNTRRIVRLLMTDL
jgi:hypothetical protein